LFARSIDQQVFLLVISRVASAKPKHSQLVCQIVQTGVQAPLPLSSPGSHTSPVTQPSSSVDSLDAYRIPSRDLELEDAGVRVIAAGGNEN
jgi:hypothetical protein